MSNWADHEATFSLHICTLGDNDTNARLSSHAVLADGLVDSDREDADKTPEPCSHQPLASAWIDAGGRLDQGYVLISRTKQRIEASKRIDHCLTHP